MKKLLVPTLLCSVLGASPAWAAEVNAQITDLVLSGDVEAPRVSSRITDAGSLRGLLWVPVFG